MGRRNDDDEGFFAPQLPAEPLPLIPPFEQSRIYFGLFKTANDLGIRTDDEFRPPASLFLKVAQQARQHIDADIAAGAQARQARTGGFGHASFQLQHAFRIGQQPERDGRGFAAAPLANDEGMAERALELLEMLRHRRLGQANPCGRRTEAAALQQRQQRRQMLDVEMGAAHGGTIRLMASRGVRPAKTSRMFCAARASMALRAVTVAEPIWAPKKVRG